MSTFSSPPMLLVPHQREDLKALGGEWWLTSSRFEAVRGRLWGFLDRVVEAMRDARLPVARDSLVLAGFATSFLRHEGSVAEALRSRRNSDLQGDRWEEAFDLLGRAAVERYVRGKLEAGAWGPTPAELALVSADDLEADIEALINLALEHADASRRDSIREGLATTNLPQVGDLRDHAVTRLVEALQATNNLVRRSDDGEIPLGEQETEIEKAALMRLRARDLQQLARERNVTLVRDPERLVDLIVRQSGITREEIAEFVLRHEGPNVEHGIITRLLPLRESPNLDQCEALLAGQMGGYARLRVARWFLFDDLHRTTHRLELRGRCRHFRATPVLDLEDYKVNATPRTEDLRIVLRRAQAWAETSARTTADAEDARVVIDRAAEARTRSAISLPVPPLEGAFSLWDAGTVWMLELLEHHLPDAHVGITDFRMAQFEAVASDAPPTPERPQINQVRLKGQHVGAHRDSCQLIVDGRRLQEVELKLHFVPTPREWYEMVVRLGVSDDMAIVMTAASDAPSTVTARLHDVLVEKVRVALETTVEVGALLGLFHKIAERARQAEAAPERADMFAVDRDSVAGTGEERAGQEDDGS